VSTAPSARLSSLPPSVLGIVLALLLSTCSIAPATSVAPLATPTVLGDLEPLPAESAKAPAGDQQEAAADGDEIEPEPEVGEPSEAEGPAEPETAGEESVEPEDVPESEPVDESGGRTLSEATESVDLADAPVLASAEPTRVKIPRIGVDHRLVAVGLHPDRTLVVPDDPHIAGWYTGRPKPGDTGPAIITGHNQWSGQLGVFWDLHRLGPGDVIEVHYDDASVVRFEIDRLEQHPKDAFPTQLVYGDTERAELRVITCGGHFDRDRRSHVDNVIAFGVRVD
jgi:hypothetical protein